MIKTLNKSTKNKCVFQHFFGCNFIFIKYMITTTNSLIIILGIIQEKNHLIKQITKINNNAIKQLLLKENYKNMSM